jgi:hypothetical protein
MQEHSQPSDGRVMLAFAASACCVAALALAFSLGRHWPVGAGRPAAPADPSLNEIRQRGAIPFAELAIDRGTEQEKLPAASASADDRSETRTTGEE